MVDLVSIGFVVWVWSVREQRLTFELSRVWRLQAVARRLE